MVPAIGMGSYGRLYQMKIVIAQRTCSDVITNQFILEYVDIRG